MNFFVKAIIDSDSSDEVLSTIWGFLNEKGDESTTLSLIEDMSFLDIKNLEKAWALIEEKGGIETANLLAKKIVGLTQLNREVLQDRIDDERIKTVDLSDQEIIELNQFNRDKIWDFSDKKGDSTTVKILLDQLLYLTESDFKKAFDFVDKKIDFGDMETISTIVETFNADIDSTTSTKIISELWKILERKGGSTTAELLAINILKFHGKIPLHHQNPFLSL
jgi:hypothetical protein